MPMWVKLEEPECRVSKGRLVVAVITTHNRAGVTLTPVRTASSVLGHDLYKEKGFLFCVGGFVQEDMRALMGTKYSAAPKLCLAARTTLTGLAC